MDAGPNLRLVELGKERACRPQARRAGADGGADGGVAGGLDGATDGGLDGGGAGGFDGGGAGGIDGGGAGGVDGGGEGGSEGGASGEGEAGLMMTRALMSLMVSTQQSKVSPTYVGPFRATTTSAGAIGPSGFR